MTPSHSGKPRDMSRRGFLQVVSVTSAAGLSLDLAASEANAPAPPRPRGRQRPPAVVRGAFLYPPTETLRQAGYYSWPGSDFDAEGHQRAYAAKLREIEKGLGIKLALDEKPLDDEASVSRFIGEVKESKPDGLLLIPFKKSHWTHVTRIMEETGAPTVVLATLGVLLVDHIAPVHRKPGVYLINSLDNFDAVEYGMKMIRAASRMRNGRIINIDGAETKEVNVPVLGTQIRTIPHQRFYDEFAHTEPSDEVTKLAHDYLQNAKEVVQPTKDDILEAAKCYFALKRLIEAEEADAMMMQCLPGLQQPHKHVPPCMGFMSLRDEGIPAGCQSDLNSTLTLLLVQELFDRPGFQQNASMETERNHYFGAHCTAPTRMKGPSGPREPYILMNHCEAGWGCVPRVLFSKDEDVTLALYRSGDKPDMLVYTGKIVGCPSIPPCGGCRSNIEMTINELADACDVQGMHQIIFYGNSGKQLRDFCQLCSIPAINGDSNQF